MNSRGAAGTVRASHSWVLSRTAPFQCRDSREGGREEACQESNTGPDSSGRFFLLLLPPEHEWPENVNMA